MSSDFVYIIASSAFVYISLYCCNVISAIYYINVALSVVSKGEKFYYDKLSGTYKG